MNNQLQLWFTILLFQIIYYFGFPAIPVDECFRIQAYYSLFASLKTWFSTNPGLHVYNNIKWNLSFFMYEK